MPDRTIYWPPVLDEENFIAKSDTGLLFQKIKIESET